MRLRRMLLVAAALLVPAAAAAARPVVAIQDDQITNDPRPAVVAVRADRLASTGAKLTRVNVDWSLVAPTRPADPSNPDDPAYRWEALDASIQALNDRGIAVLTVMFGTPPWASTSGKWNATPRPIDFGTFAGALARRYSGTWPKPGGGVLPRIKSISPGNEPNLSFWITPQCKRVRGHWVPASPAAYAAMLKAASKRIRAAAPGILVVAGETLAGDGNGCTGPTSTVGTIEFTRLLHKALGRKVPFDAWAVHLHPVGPPDRSPFLPSWPTLPRITREVNKIHPKMPILVTETSYATAYSAYHRYFVTEAQQAKWLDLTYTLAARQPQVEAVVWFNLQDNFDWPAGVFRDDWSAKPSFDRFRQLATSTPIPPKWALP
jgi:hypothetical protein